MTQSNVKSILQKYRYKPVMEDLNPTAWEKVYLNNALSELIKLVEGIKIPISAKPDYKWGYAKCLNCNKFLIGDEAYNHNENHSMSFTGGENQGWNSAIDSVINLLKGE